MPTEIRKALEPIVTQWQWLLPTWCHELTVAFENSPDPDCDASCEAQPEYRQAHIIIHQGWLQEAEEVRVQQVVHELCHVVVAPLALFVHGLLDKLFTEPSKALMEEQERVALESVVQDMASTIYERTNRQTAKANTRAR